MRREIAALSIVALVASAGCAHYPLNAPLEGKPDLRKGYRFGNMEPSATNTNELFVCLAFSGGGVRASAFSYGVLEKLRDTRIQWKGSEKRLLDEIDCISSVSGGSFTSAYYGLFHDRLFTDFRERFLYAETQGGLGWEVAKPVNWFRLGSSYFDRIDLAAEYYGDHIFENKTFSDLIAQKRRPFIMINATNMANGEQLSFTQSDFDYIGSDLSGYSIARAVAASSAFPFLLSPLTLANHPHDPIPDDGLEDYETNPARFRRARNLRAYADAAAKPYVHLMDGGLADNIGVRALETAFQRGFINELVNRSGAACSKPGGCIEELVFIVVNANAKGEDDLSQRESAPGLADVAFKTATVAMDTHSYDSITSLATLQDQFDKEQVILQTCSSMIEKRDACTRKEFACAPQAPSEPCAGAEPPKLPGRIAPRVIIIDFDGIQDETKRTRFESISTALELERPVIDELIATGADILGKNPTFKELLEEIALRGRPQRP